MTSLIPTMNAPLLYDMIIEEEKPRSIYFKHDMLDLDKSIYEQDILYNKITMEYIKNNIEEIDEYFNSMGTNFMMLSLRRRNDIYIRYFIETFGKNKPFIKRTLNYVNMMGNNFFMMFMMFSFGINDKVIGYKEPEDKNTIINFFKNNLDNIDFTQRNDEGDNFLFLCLKNKNFINNRFLKIVIEYNPFFSKKIDLGLTNINNEGNTLLYYIYNYTMYISYISYSDLDVGKDLNTILQIIEKKDPSIFNNLNIRNETFIVYIVKHEKFKYSNKAQFYSISESYNKYFTNIYEKDCDGKNLLYHYIFNNINTKILDYVDIKNIKSMVSQMKSIMINLGIKSDNYYLTIMKDLIQQDIESNRMIENKNTIFILFWKMKNFRNTLSLDDTDMLSLIRSVDIEYLNHQNNEGDNVLMLLCKQNKDELVKEMLKINGIKSSLYNKRGFSVLTYIFNLIDNHELLDLYLDNYIYIPQDYRLSNSGKSDLIKIFGLNNRDLTIKIFEKIGIEYQRTELIFLKLRCYLINKELYNHLYDIYSNNLKKHLKDTLNKDEYLPNDIIEGIFESIYSV